MAYWLCKENIHVTQVNFNFSFVFLLVLPCAFPCQFVGKHVTPILNYPEQPARFVVPGANIWISILVAIQNVDIVCLKVSFSAICIWTVMTCSIHLKHFFLVQARRVCSSANVAFVDVVQVGSVTAICFTCFLVRCCVVSICFHLYYVNICFVRYIFASLIYDAKQHEGLFHQRERTTYVYIYSWILLGDKKGLCI